MKVLALCGFVALIIGNGILASPVEPSSTRLLGKESCTWGPSYWCENIQQAKQCKAFKHCRQTIWETHRFPEDNDEICKICLDMVKQARDQLRSNETQLDLKAVFEGSCALIPLKIVRKECIKMADDFVPELVEALSSQMDPTAVCSIAGLCNNAKIDQMLLEATKDPWAMVETEDLMVKDDFDCAKCNKIGGIITDNFHKSQPDDVLETMLQMCGKMSSFSDACASIVLINFEDIYGFLKTNLNKDGLCHLSGVCSDNFHQGHDEPKATVEIRPMSNVGVVPVDDIPCELCEQLIKHLRDVVLTNTTETEFKQILQGLCGQMKAKKQECLNVVNAYSDMIFNALNEGLNPKMVCGVINICSESTDRPLIMPLLPVSHKAEIQVTIKKYAADQQAPRKVLGEDEPRLTKEEIDAMQLPFDQLMGPQNANQLVDGGESCTICEMILHFLQEVLANPKTEDDIKTKFEKACTVLPKSVATECQAFVDSYGDAVVALLIQDIDPSQVCPMLKMCSGKTKEDVEIFATKTQSINVDINGGDKPTCPLCLFAVTEAQNRIKSDKSVANIKRTLDSLCSHLPQKLIMECTDFVDTYSKELITMLVNDFSAQQICVELKLCTEVPPKTPFNPLPVDNDILTNDIFDNTVDGMVIIIEKPFKFAPDCLICERIVEEVEKRVVNKHSREEIKYILDHFCDKVEEKMKEKCVAFMKAHEEQIIDLVMKDVTPKQLCRVLGFCSVPERENLEDQQDNFFMQDLDIDEALPVDFISLPASAPHDLFQMFYKSPELAVEPPEEAKPPAPVTSNQGCILCEFVMTKLEKDLQNKTTEDEIRHAVENICHKMPKTIVKQCVQFVDNYSEMLITLLTTMPPAKICEEMKLCQPPKLEDESVESLIQGSTNDVVECAVCQSAVIFIDKLLEDPKFDHNLEQVVEKVCSVVPKLHQRKCRELVEAYGPSMINLLLSKANPNEVCEQVKLCFPREISAFVKMEDDSAVPVRIRRDAE